MSNFSVSSRGPGTYLSRITFFFFFLPSFLLVWGVSNIQLYQKVGPEPNVALLYYREMECCKTILVIWMGTNSFTCDWIMCPLYFLPSHLLIFPFISPLPAKGKFRELGYLSKSNKLLLCTIAQYMSAYYFPTSSPSVHRRCGAQGTSRYSVVLFSSLFAVQLHELFTHTIQSIFRRQLLISSWALLWCSLLQYPNASQILMYLLLYCSLWEVLASV